VALAANGRVDGQADLDFTRGKVGSIPTPHATLHTKGFRQLAGAFGGDATLVVDEPGAPTTLTLHAVPTERSSKVEFDIVSHDVRLGAVRSISAEATGNARVVGKGASTSTTSRSKRRSGRRALALPAAL